MKNFVKNKKNIFIIIGVILFVFLVAGITYAYYSRILFEDLSVKTLTPGLDYYINYTKGNDLTDTILNSGYDYESGNKADIKFYKKDNTYDHLYGHIYLNINVKDESLIINSGALKYELLKNGEHLESGTLDQTILNQGKLVTLNDISYKKVPIKEDIDLDTTETTYTVYIWLDESMDIDIEAEGEILDITVSCEATMKPLT